MALLLTEQEVQRLASVPDAVEALEGALRRRGEGQAINRPRRRLHVPGGALHLMAAADLGTGVLGFKAYFGRAGRTSFHVLLYAVETGELLAMIQAAALGAIRTGAASGVATRYMAPAEAATLGVIGTGGQAWTQVAAVCAVRPVRRVLAYSRDEGSRQKFAERIGASLGVEARAVADPGEAASAAVVATATTSATPVLLGEWLSPGVHVNAIGSNSLLRRELDLAAVRRADRVVVDDREQATLECGDLLEAWERGLVDRARLPELADVVAGRAIGRAAPEEITLFESQGVALWDVALAEAVYRRARERGEGTEVAL